MKHRWIANLDMYRKVPVDLLEGSRQGSIISWIALFVIATLFFIQTKAFFTHGVETILALDSSQEKLLRVNFNITLMDVKCEFANLNVVSVFGGKQHTHNATTVHVTKFTVDSSQVRRQYMDRNMQQHDIDLHDRAVTESVEQMVEHKQREDAISLSPEELEFVVTQHMFVFVDMFASWCSHCQLLAPTWEKLAGVVRDAADTHIKQEHPEHVAYSDEEYQAALQVHLPVVIAKVDCVQYHEFCMEQGIMGYPTLRLFVKGAREGDYHGDRTILAMTQFLKVAEERHKEEVERLMHTTDAILQEDFNISEEDRKWATFLERDRHQRQSLWNPEEHPGCQLSGYLHMDRAPGHFYIQAQSQSHDLNPYMTNLSHTINHLSFGDEKATRYFTGLISGNRGIVFPPNFHDSLHPLDGNVYVTPDLHEAYHHYIKLVGTNVYSYQVVPSTQLAKYREDSIPEAKFIIDLSPISVTYRATTRRWYDYVTSLMAIIGGTFTVVGMLEAGARRVSHVVRHEPHRHAY